ncbi:MAG: hypothetical protein WKF89_14640 [Chitinophagaceae bacterium]
MIKMQELKVGDYVLAAYEGKEWEGIVKQLDFEDKRVCIETEIQEFWFEPQVLQPIQLSEEQLVKLNFEKQEYEDGSVKFMKGPFRIFLAEKGNFNKLDIWYREDRRHLNHPLSVHELQNHYNQMTKVDLTRN